MQIPFKLTLYAITERNRTKQNWKLRVYTGWSQKSTSHQFDIYDIDMWKSQKRYKSAEIRVLLKKKRWKEKILAEICRDKWSWHISINYRIRNYSNFTYFSPRYFIVIFHVERMCPSAACAKITILCMIPRDKFHAPRNFDTRQSSN